MIIYSTVSGLNDFSFLIIRRGYNIFIGVYEIEACEKS